MKELKQTPIRSPTHPPTHLLYSPLQEIHDLVDDLAVLLGTFALVDFPQDGVDPLFSQCFSV